MQRVMNISEKQWSVDNQTKRYVIIFSSSDKISRNRNDDQRINMRMLLGI